jgi:hypothetical protein
MLKWNIYIIKDTMIQTQSGRRQLIFITQVCQKKKKISSHFQYSERTKATTETRNISKESSEPQLFLCQKDIDVALSGGLHTNLL